MPESAEFQEKRRSPRYEVDLPLAMPGAENLRLKDISASGIGLVCREALSLGSQVDMQLHMPDNHEQIPLHGQIVWVNRLGENQFRAGLRMSGGFFNPIPLVLRGILYQAQARQHADRWSALQSFRKSLP